ncbi:uncharacterized protein LOC131228513 isoform X2 [Magnolia sinica]|uniref:uncharacterized protein LOC131228513 isoform X2 n=1 Tax=Magnolia sinica TaxID=86752 RepID=UPI0026580676|nr:uncharacterized protein LOC131228513 isoform X2 [Magnolia sinica]
MLHHLLHSRLLEMKILPFLLPLPQRPPMQDRYTSKLHVIDLGAQPGQPGFTKKQADLFFPPDFADDFPVAMQQAAPITRAEEDGILKGDGIDYEVPGKGLNQSSILEDMESLF